MAAAGSTSAEGRLVGGTHAHLRSGRGRAAAVGVGWSLANTATATFASALVFLVSSRFLEAGDFGVVALAASVVAIVGCLTPLAFGEAIVQREEVRDVHLDTVFWGCCAAAAAAYMPLLLLRDWIAALSGVPILADLLPVVGLRLVFDLLAAVPMALVTRRMDFRAVALRTAIANGLGGVLCVWMVLGGYGFWALAASQVTISAVGLLVIAPVARWRPGLKVRRKAMADLWSFGVFSTGSRLINDMRLDQLLLGLLAGPATLGLYFFARRLFEMLTSITAGAFTSVSHVLFSAMQNEGDKRREAFTFASYASTAVAFPAFAGLFTVADPGVALLFGAQWAEAVPAVRGLAIIGLLAGLGIVQSAFIRGQGKANWWFWYEAGVQASVLPVIALFHGAGLTVLMTALVVHRLLLWPVSVAMTLSLLGLGLMAYGRSLAPPALAAAVMTAVVWLMPAMLPDGTGPAVVLVLQVVVGAVSYGAVLCALSWRWLRRLLDLVRNRRPKTE
jgi:teichuronic acid exporter